MSDAEKFKKILRDYAEEKLSPSDEKKIEHLIVKHAAKNRWEWENESHKKQLEQKIISGIEQKIRKDKPKKTRLFYYSTAAAAILVITFGLFWKIGKTPSDENTVILAQAKELSSEQIIVQSSNGDITELASEINILDLQNSSVLDQPKPNATTTIQIPQQKQLNLILPDGTKVWLNAGTKFEFSSKLSKEDKRIVKVDGEAYFEVTSDKQHPFIVNTHHSNVEVTGTQFNIKSYAGENFVETALVEGQVSFNTNNKTYKISPGRKITAHVDKQTIQETAFDIASETSWKDGYFTFNQTDLFDVMSQVSKWYNITVKANKYINKVKIGGTFPKDLPLTDLLKDLSLLSNVEFKIEGKEVILIR
ncbi:FecR family protein [Sphingobacterium sp. UT-1RO-CII-1]|uniref:FecR family protein n=1 Tax=Sphingobacterium sp. UT-1RO-CII-1 TaxID=2995225 RepID=UPI00227A1365|nr:FecR family protein [Sphingobacterium sp. UT-1RO-CII-1]MCY4780028.1 FecR family protein [Sphingobacterium sp. UT-1RO-CII-1]